MVLCSDGRILSPMNSSSVALCSEGRRGWRGGEAGRELHALASPNFRLVLCFELKDNSLCREVVCSEAVRGHFTMAKPIKHSSMFGRDGGDMHSATCLSPIKHPSCRWKHSSTCCSHCACFTVSHWRGGNLEHWGSTSPTSSPMET